MRCIDADALMPKLKAIVEAENQIYRRESWGFAIRCVEAVEDAPTIEPEQVHCKDCLMHGVCRFEQGLGLDGYCSKAERREEGGE